MRQICIGERYAMFMLDDHTLLVGCQECDEPLFSIDLEEGPDVAIGDLLRKHEAKRHKFHQGGK